MAFCTNCGSQVDDKIKFCPNCGKKIVGKEPVDPAPIQENTVIPAQAETHQEFEASAQGSYQASYIPPVQQTSNPPEPEAPIQQSYTPSAQQSYAPPVQQTNVAVKEKKQLNKKLLFIIGGAVIVVIIVVLLIALLGGKGGKNASDDPNLGKYSAVQAEMMGIEVDVSSIYEEGFIIELKNKGKCSMTIDGTKGSGTWTLEDGVFHVKGGGLDCEGTLEKGILTLTDVMDMGIDMIFEKEGYVSSGDAGDSYLATLPGASTGSAAPTAIQKQWNGTWYGCMYVSEATGDFSGIPSDFYDVYMVVDVDGEGKGQFAVYLANVDEAFAMANCEAKEAGLYAADGTVAGGVDMYAYNWMFLPMPDYPDQYAMGDTIEDGDSVFDFTLFMKQWGGSWQKEVDSDFAIVPPSVDSYNAAIENGELPPIGFAPIDYDGSSAPSGGSSSSGSSDSPSGADGGGAALSGDVDVYNYYDEIYVSYPTDTFSVGSVSGLDAIVANDGSVEISIDVKYNEGGHDYTMQYFDGLSSEQDYKSTNMTIAGYDTRCVTYCDPGRLRPYYADYHVCFKDEGHANYGVNFYVTSADSAEACTSETVLAILNTLTIAG